MEYIAFYCSKAENDRNSDIKYCVFKDGNSYGIESFVCGGSFSEKVLLGNCGEKRAEHLAELFAGKAVHPIHIEDIISDMRF